MYGLETKQVEQDKGYNDSKESKPLSKTLGAKAGAELVGEDGCDGSEKDKQREREKENKQQIRRCRYL